MKPFSQLGNGILLGRRRDAERAMWGVTDTDHLGVFEVGPLRIIATNGDGWDHVSVSRATRCPTWEEMERVKRWFFLPTEYAMQLHVPVADHINCHPNCLHLWRPHDTPIPLPPPELV